jgi:hypothetical protein
VIHIAPVADFTNKGTQLLKDADNELLMDAVCNTGSLSPGGSSCHQHLIGLLTGRTSRKKGCASKARHV